MGGNTTIKTQGGVDISAERIPLKEIGRDKFVKKFQRFLLKLNKDFKKEYKFPIWEDEKEIMNGGIFNGSTSFIMNPNYNSDEIVKYKPSAGDLDVMVPREIGKEIFNFLQKNEGKDFIPGIRYVGNNANNENKLGNTIICIVNATFGEISIQAQMDLELSEMVSGKGTDWAKLAHSSTFEDAKAGIKGVASKYYLRALVGALHQLDSGFIVATPSSNPDKIILKKKQPSKIRLMNFGVDSGIGAGYEVMMKDGKPMEIDGNVVYKEKKPSEKTYDKNVINLMKLLFNTDKLKPTDLHSFISLLKLTDKYSDKKIKQVTLDRFMSILFGEDGQAQYIEPEPIEDIRLKSGMYMKAVEMLHLTPSKDLDDIIKRYNKKVHNISERFRRFLGLYEEKETNDSASYPDDTNNSTKKKKEETSSKDEKQKSADKEKSSKEAEQKEIVKKLINLSIELDQADSDDEKAKIQAQMDKLDKDSNTKKKEAKKYDKEKKQAKKDSNGQSLDVDQSSEVDK